MDAETVTQPPSGAARSRRAFRYLLAAGFTVAGSRGQDQPVWDGLQADSGWTRIHGDSALRVYVKSLPASPVQALKLELTTSAPPERLLDHIWAVDRYPQSLPSAHITAAGFLERHPDRQVAWQVIDIPLLEPRLYVYEHVRREGRIEWRAVPESVPVADYADLIRPVLNMGSWEVLSGGQATRLIYRVCTDPRGRVPAWVVNQANQRWLPQMLRELEQAALQDRP